MLLFDILVLTTGSQSQKFSNRLSSSLTKHTYSADKRFRFYFFFLGFATNTLWPWKSTVILSSYNTTSKPHNLTYLYTKYTTHASAVLYALLQTVKCLAFKGKAVKHKFLRRNLEWMKKWKVSPYKKKFSNEHHWSEVYLFGSIWWSIFVWKTIQMIIQTIKTVYMFFYQSCLN